MDLYDKENIRKILIGLYGDQAKQWDINDRTAQIVLKMIMESKSCSEAVGYVPSPVPVPAANTVKKVLTNQAKKLIKSFADDATNLHCLKTAARNFRSDLQSGY